MRLLGSGFNAHNQLNSTSEDLYGFTQISRDVDRVHLATWSTLIWSSKGSITLQGHQKQVISTSIASTARSFVGDHNGLSGMLDGDKLICVEAEADDQAINLHRVATDASPRFKHIAVARNGRTIAVHSDHPEGGRRISEFPSFAAFRAWYADPSSEQNQPRTEHSFEHSIKQLVAGSTSFALLTTAGEVYTWGEARRCSLGRSTVVNDGSSNANRPGFVAALGGIKIKSISHGGWMFGAVSEDGAAYLWGLDMPQSDSEIDSLAHMPAEDEVALIELGNGDEEPEIIDMAIGEGHVALVTAAGELYVAGSNSNGQLGLGPDVDSAADWQHVPFVTGATSVMCGPNITALLVK